VKKITFHTEQVQPKSKLFNSFCMKTAVFGENAAIIGDTAFAYLNKDGDVVGNYVYSGIFSGCDLKGTKIAVILKDDVLRKYTLVFSDSPDGIRHEIVSDEPYRNVLICENLVYAQSAQKIEAYDFNGNLRSIVGISDSYNGFKRSEDYIFLMNYRHIDRIDYAS